MDENSLQVSFWIMVLVQTIGSVDMPGRGPRKMPAPRQYVAILVTWTVLFLVARISAGAARAAAALGWVVLAAGMVMGPFGSALVGLLKSTASNFSFIGTSSQPPAPPS